MSIQLRALKFFNNILLLLLKFLWQAIQVILVLGVRMASENDVKKTVRGLPKRALASGARMASENDVKKTR